MNIQNCIFILLAMILILLIIHNLYYSSCMIDHFDSETISVPVQNAYQPLTSAPNNEYVYVPEAQAYLLPFDDLDFSNPFDAWMYYYYPMYYSSYYPYYWPFGSVGGWGGYAGPYGYSTYGAGIRRGRRGGRRGGGDGRRIGGGGRRTGGGRRRVGGGGGGPRRR